MATTKTTKKTTKKTVKKAVKKPAKKTTKKAELSSSFAVIETGGKQYLVREGQILNVEKLNVPASENISFDKVLLIADGDKVKMGKPFIDGAKVMAESMGEVRGKKVISVRYKNKTRASTKRGHRQTYTRIKISKI